MERVTAKNKRFKLDQAATIFPSTLSKTQHHIYNFTITLTKTVDGKCLQEALSHMVTRFPTIMARLRTGLCWYTLETVAAAPEVARGITEKMRPMSRAELRKCCLRVAYEGCRISVDFFHALTDGCGAAVFMQTFIAEYIRLCYGVSIQAAQGILQWDEAPKPEEMMDCYEKNARKPASGYAFSPAYKHRGLSQKQVQTQEVELDADYIRNEAKRNHATVTEYLAAVMLLAMDEVRQRDPSKKKGVPVRLAVPCDLRKLFGCYTLRNFSLCCTVTLEDEKELAKVCESVHRQLTQQYTPAAMAGCIGNNSRILRIVRWALPPLFLKNLGMRIGYRLFGSSAASMSLSNLGVLTLPEGMKPYIRDFACWMDTNVLDTHNCTVLTYNGKLRLHFSRSVKEGVLEDAVMRLQPETKMNAPAQPAPSRVEPFGSRMTSRLQGF